MTDAKKASRGRPRKPGKTPFNFRMSEGLRQRLTESAEKAGLSMTEETELRLNRDFAWEASKQDIEEMKRDTAKLRDTEHLIALRLAGFQIMRETDGRPTRVVVDLQSLLAEADGISRGLRSGFTDDSASSPAERAADAELRMLEELEQDLRKRKQALLTRAAGGTAKKPGKVA
jgi:hypothetical protein